MDSPETHLSSTILARIVVLLLLGATGITTVIAFTSTTHDQELEDATAAAKSLRELAVRPPPKPEVEEIVLIPTKADCDLVAPLPPPVICPPPPPIDPRSELGLRELGDGLSRQDIELRCRTYLNFAPVGDPSTIFRTVGKE